MALDDNLTPLTREEEYLAAMAGEDVEIPEPITRKEKFYTAIIQSGGGGGGGGGTTNYTALSNKPQINGVTLTGNKTGADLGLANASDIPTDFYSKAEVDTKLSGKADTADIPTDFYSKSEVDTKLSGKVDTVDGMGLSANSYTTAEKAKLAGIEAGAEANPDVATEDADGLMAAADKREIALLRELIAGIDGPIYRTASGNAVSVSDGYDGAAVKALSVEIQPVQSGSGDPSPDNVRPIAGWDSVTVTRTGKNLLEITAESETVSGVTFTVDAQAGTITADGTATADLYFLVNRFKPKDDVSYILSGCPADSQRPWNDIYCYTGRLADGVIDVGSGSEPFTGANLDAAEWNRSYYIYIKSGVVCSNLVFRPMIRLASETDAAFEPFRGRQAVTVSIGEAGTVCGGTLDVTTGVLTVTWKLLDLGSISWTPRNYASYFTSETIADAPAPVSGGYDCLCDIYLANRVSVAGFMSSDYRLLCFADGISTTNQWIALRDTRYTTASELRAALSGHYLAYPLATPVTYQLTAQSVTTLAGVNTVSADAGAVRVTYRVNAALSLES